MIPTEVFTTLLSVAFVLAIYSFIDLSNRIYGNIVAAFISAILFGFLSVIANTGIVGLTGYSMADQSLQIILIIPTATMMIFTGYMVLDAWNESQAMEVEDE
jgi:lipopolysaccharide export LptBFGC system permease protein LptF